MYSVHVLHTLSHLQHVQEHRTCPSLGSLRCCKQNALKWSVVQQTNKFTYTLAQHSKDSRWENLNVVWVDPQIRLLRVRRFSTRKPQNQDSFVISVGYISSAGRLKGQLVPVQAVWGEYSFPASALVRCELRPLYPRGKKPDTHWIGSWVGPRPSLDGFAVELRPCRDSNARPSSP